VAEVRACYNGDATVKSAQPSYPPEARATDKQANYLASLMKREAIKLADDRSPADVEKRTASVLIDNLVARAKARKAGTKLPALHPDFQPTGEAPAKEEPETRPFPKVSQAGGYATKSRTGHNDLDFWWIDIPEEGRWKGYQFVKRVIGGRPSVSVRGAEAREAVEAILAAGEDKAGELFGQKLGKCRFCRRHLTDEVSRQYGAGPDCRAARGIG
jgi:hypothetical protein